MTESETQSRRRLFTLLDTIVEEERAFKKQARHNATPECLEGFSQNDGREPARRDDLRGFRLAHEEICRLHNKFIGEHELLIQRCLAISRQTKAGLLNENEVVLEVERLQQELLRIKREHSLVEKEYREAVREQGGRLIDSEPKG